MLLIEYKKKHLYLRRILREMKLNLQPKPSEQNSKLNVKKHTYSCRTLFKSQFSGAKPWLHSLSTTISRQRMFVAVVTCTKEDKLHGIYITYLLVLHSCIPYPITNNITRPNKPQIYRWKGTLRKPLFVAIFLLQQYFETAANTHAKKQQYVFQHSNLCATVTWQPDDYSVPNKRHWNPNIKHSTPRKKSRKSSRLNWQR